jgi:opacity protein-like surface antigen
MSLPHSRDRFLSPRLSSQGNPSGGIPVLIAFVLLSIQSARCARDLQDAAQMRNLKREKLMTRLAGATINLTTINLTTITLKTIALIVLVSSLAGAQDAPPKVQIFGGYSLLHEDTRLLTDTEINVALHDPTSSFGVRSNLNGWTAEAQYNLPAWVGLLVDVSGYSGVPFTATTATGSAGLPRESRYSFLIGPALTYRNKTRFTPYLHALFGLERAHLNASTLANSSPPFTSIDTTFTDFTAALGGGVDYRISRRFALRLGQLDWYHTSLNMNKFFGNAFTSPEFEGLSTHQKNWRFSAGVVINF